MVLIFKKRFWVILILLGLLLACTTALSDTPPARLSPSEPDIAETSPVPPTVSTGLLSTQTTPAPTKKTVEYAWWNGVVFYEIFVRSFYDSDGDGVGDFIGIIEKLDYLNDGDASTTSDLGIQGIWLMPVYPSPSYHGYDVTDFMDVNPAYGKLDEFIKLLDEAHSRGIKVILDLPLNHTSVDHPWFQESFDPLSPYRNYYIWSDVDPSYPGPFGQDVWHPGPNGDYYYGLFWSGMPDLNYTHPALINEMEASIKFWMDLGVDGFRLDGARHIIEEGERQTDTLSNHQFFKDLRRFVKGNNSDTLLLGEVWVGSYISSEYTKHGDELDMVFDFDLAEAFVSSASGGYAPTALKALDLTKELFLGGKSAPFLTNHDMDRAMSMFKGDVEKAKSAAVMLLTAPGVPFIYYGEEIGMTGVRGGSNNDIKRRLPMQWTALEHAGFTHASPWTPVDSTYPLINVEAEISTQDSLFSTYRELVSLRNHNPVLYHGDTQIIESSHYAIYAIIRSDNQNQLLVLINLSDQPVTDYHLFLSSGSLHGVYDLKPILGKGDFMPLSANPQGGFDSYKPLTELPAYSRFILQLIAQE